MPGELTEEQKKFMRDNFGIDPDALAAGAGDAAAGGSTTRVYWGQRRTGTLQGLPAPAGSMEDAPLNPLTGQPMLPSIASTEPPRNYQGPYPTYEDEVLTLEQAKLRFNTMSNDEVSKLAAQLVAAGLLDEVYNYEDVESAWDKLVEKAARSTAAGLKLTPFDMISRYYGEDGTSSIGSAAKPGSAGSLTSQKLVERQVDLTNNEDARTVLTRLLVQDLGRNPTDREVDDFQAALNDAQRANPLVQTTTSSYTGTGGGESRLSSRDVVRSGGMDAGGYATTYNKEHNDKEYGQYQAATTYANALFDALRSPV